MSRWTEVFARHAKELESVLTRVLGDRSLAEDCVQDTALRILDQPFDEIRDPRAFLFQVGYNLARDALRRRQIRAGESVDDEALAPQLADPQPGPEAVVAARQQWALVKDALDELPVQRRKVLWMMRVEGKSQKEVAAELGLSPKTVENHMTLALKALTELLKRGRP